MFKHLILASIIALAACNQTPAKKSTAKKKPQIAAPDFNADSAYLYVQKQVDFGPRVPNTTAHAQCADYLSNKLKEFGADVIVQEAEVRTFDNTLLNAKNIIGQYKPEIKNRVLLFAHWGFQTLCRSL